MHYCLAICIVVVIVQFVCIILPNWSTKSVLSGTMNMGLWKACSGKVCKSIPASLDSSFPSFWLYLARILSLLGLLFTLLCIISCVMPKYEEYQSIFLLSAEISSLLAVIVWSIKLTNISGGTGAAPIKYDNGYCLYLMFLISLILLAVYVYEKVEK